MSPPVNSKTTIADEIVRVTWGRVRFMVRVRGTGRGRGRGRVGLRVKG